MSFASPIWLLGLIPWLVLAAWLLTGHRERADVPFVHLWRGIQPAPRAGRSMRLPPVAIILMLISLHFAILSAAGPTLRGWGAFQPITVIVDRGPTTDVQQDEMRAHSAQWLRAASCRVEELILVPDGQAQLLQGADWTKLASNAPLCSLDTTDLLHAAVEQARRRNNWPLLVLSDRELRIDDARVVRIGSKSPVENVGIVSIAAREHPRDQVMVRIRNQSSSDSADVSAAGAGEIISRTVKLAGEAQEQTVFLDLPALGEIMRVQVYAPGDRFGGDNAAWLVKQRGWPVLETRRVVPRALERMIHTYQLLRPAGEGSTRVSITTDPGEVSAAQPAIFLAAGESMRSASNLLATDAGLKVENHPIAANIEWERVAEGARVATPPSGSWRPIVRTAEHVLVAVREEPARQVWVGFDSQHWSRSPEFVMFWTNVFDWVGEGSRGFTNEPIHQLSDEWRRDERLSGGRVGIFEPAPGVYSRRDGDVRAFNCLDLQLPAPSQIDGESTTRRRTALALTARRLDAASLVAALGCALFASLFWSGRKRNQGAT